MDELTDWAVGMCLQKPAQISGLLFCHFFAHSTALQILHHLRTSPLAPGGSVVAELQVLKYDELGEFFGQKGLKWNFRACEKFASRESVSNVFTFLNVINSINTLS